MAAARAIAASTCFQEDSAATVEASPPSKDALPLDIHVIIRRSVGKTPGQLVVGNSGHSGANMSAAVPPPAAMKAPPGAPPPDAGGEGGESGDGGAESPGPPGGPPGMGPGPPGMGPPGMQPGGPAKAMMPALLPAPPAVLGSRPPSGPPPRQDRSGAVRAGAFL
eukprot:CAMPEP_0204531752 /NCGR_PEP_ID=MMETSP0661-20131031/11345_1 /ASSEMBLY_ACC=CAM_ASM_000606 /TAXON_ID=109239 /ORGANISM="Alexandrium margalefi, Strain AMGDE01CS-322" /LENGTH=164 /DNA_ID=CAMNT_0051537931 /DNA_START=13 /DNA_END=507 /DNA_ORIENTATION=-